jgi:hypothetical protein
MYFVNGLQSRSSNGAVMWLASPPGTFSFIRVIRDIRGQKLLSSSGSGKHAN